MARLADLFRKVDLNVEETGRFIVTADRIEYRGYFAEGETRTLALDVMGRVKQAQDAGRTPSDAESQDAARVFESVVLAALGQPSDATIDSSRSIEPAE